MAINKQDVLYVAGLANLELTSEEQERMVRDLSSILEYVGQLSELDTADVPATAQVPLLDSETSDREDVLRPCLPHEDAMKNAPANNGKFFKVPRVIEK